MEQTRMDTVPVTNSTTNISDLEARIQQLEARLEEVEANVPDDQVTIVMFSGELDKVIAGFIIATGALAMGQEVSIFFTFWGLNALRKQRIMTDKSVIEKAFAIMQPADTYGMGLSKMDYFGMGAKMMRHIMKSKNVESIEDLIDLTIDMGARIVACGMSQDVIGIKSEELRDGIDEGGVAAYLGDALRSKVTLFI
jgi:peroxiredoxin family protein